MIPGTIGMPKSTEGELKRETFYIQDDVQKLIKWSFDFHFKLELRLRSSSTRIHPRCGMLGLVLPTDLIDLDCPWENDSKACASPANTRSNIAIAIDVNRLDGKL